jgi:hypothetical protein
MSNSDCQGSKMQVQIYSRAAIEVPSEVTADESVDDAVKNTFVAFCRARSPSGGVRYRRG